jgi:FMN phosphatase YigB (HAD superfamily)
MTDNIEKLILTDVDGVVLDWEKHFHEYMHSHGHWRDPEVPERYWKELDYPRISEEEARQMVLHYNTSAWMMDVPPFRDALSGVARLRENGFQLHAITAMGNDPYSYKAREYNLKNLFGRGVFHLTCTDMNNPDSKRPMLESYENTGLPWIEDKPFNANMGAELGLNTFLIDHPHNAEAVLHDSVKRVNSWAEICDALVGAN